MPSVQLSVNTTLGQAKFERLRKAIAPETILNTIGGRLLSYVDESFRTSGRGHWAPLSPLTIQMRRRGSSMPLQDTGQLKGSYVGEQGGPGRDYKTDGRTYVEVGSNVKTPDGKHSLAAVHEYGATIEPKPGSVWHYSYIAKKSGRTVTVTRPAMLVLGKIGDRLIFAKRVVIPARPVLPSKAVAERLVRQTIEGMLSRIQAPGDARFGAGMPAVFRSNR